jgi:protein phosphatase
MGFLRRILTDQRASDRELVAPGGSSRRVLRIVSDRLCALTDMGRQRETNEDAVYASDDGCLLAVADGMGGEAAGEQASALSIEAVRAVFDAAPAEREIPASQLLLRAFQHAQATVIRASNEHPSWKGMGAALVVAYIAGDDLFVCHAGDARCYLATNGRIERITDDHSIVAQLLKKQQITAEQAIFHPQKGMLLQAIGLPSGIAPKVVSRKLDDGDRVLLCSDGAWEGISEDDIRCTLTAEGTMREVAIILADQAYFFDGSDNISVVLYQHARETRPAGFPPEAGSP